MGSQISRHDQDRKEKLEKESRKMEDSLKVKSKAHDDQKRREKLEEELKKMEDNLKVKSKAH